MARPKKERQVEGLPEVCFYKPAGVPLRLLEEVVVTVEEAEALRLSDYDGLSQLEAAECMKVSRATYQRVLQSVHQKIADAMFNGKAIRIDGGNYEIRSGLDHDHLKTIIKGESKKMKFAVPVFGS